MTAIPPALADLARKTKGGRETWFRRARKLSGDPHPAYISDAEISAMIEELIAWRLMENDTSPENSDRLVAAVQAARAATDKAFEE